MKSIRELLQDADPLQHEPALSPGERDFRRQAVLAAASGGAPPACDRSREWLSSRSSP